MDYEKHSKFIGHLLMSPLSELKDILKDPQTNMEERIIVREMLVGLQKVDMNLFFKFADIALGIPPRHKF